MDVGRLHLRWADRSKRAFNGQGDGVIVHHEGFMKAPVLTPTYKSVSS